MTGTTTTTPAPSARRAHSAFAAMAVAAALVACEVTSNLGSDPDDAGGGGSGAGGDAAEPTPSSADGAPSDAPTPAPEVGDRDGGSEGGPGGTYPYGFPCDPIVNQGCPPDATCLLRYPSDGGPATVSCVPSTSSCSGRPGGTLCAVETADGGFVRGGICRDVPGSPSAACMASPACDVAARQGSARGCPSPRACAPIDERTGRGYGYCIDPP